MSDGRRRAGQERHPARLQRVEQRGRRARGDEEARAGGERSATCARRRDRAGADDRALDLGRDPLDRGQRGRRAQRHLDRRQPAAHERLGQRHGVLDVVDHDDRDHRRERRRLPRRSSRHAYILARSRPAKTDAPSSGRPTRSRNAANSSRPVPWLAARGMRRLALAEVDVDLEPAALGVDAHDVAVAQARQRPAGGRLGRAVDRRRDLARGAAHAAVGDERDAVAAVLQHAQRGRELVQLGHPVGARALVADDRDDVAVELAALEGGEEVAPGRRTRAPARSRRGARARRRDTFITARPSAPSSTRMPPSGANALADAAQDARVARLARRGAPAQLVALVQVRLVAVAPEAVPGDRLARRGA